MTNSDLFQLDQRLAATSIAIGRKSCIEVRLVDDSRYQWLMLVPCLPNIVELDDLPPDIVADLFRLAGDLGRWLKASAAADKINIAMIGNVVPQMHVHVVARHRDDADWPDPIWGRGAPQPMPEATCAARAAALAAWLETWN
ncbi:MAG: HIT family protein [Candidatus Puniceispirillaceae bacterium]